MAKRARAASAQPNTPDPKVMNALLDRWDEVQQDRESDRGAFRAQCKDHKESEERILEEAKARGIDPKLFKKTIKRRDLSRKIDALNHSIGDDEIADWEAMWEAAAARDAKKPSPGAQQKAADTKANADAFDDFTDPA
ncbi:hypothetical protein [Xanthobacter aminoxidans]|uniref:hypothetical protein n=1 Tax=Xanthobacter aminoxidans TaxID=186280 RepID=UPI002022B99E|nr:hypothetical protein [Xanthobacter aminoxidans]MCL8382094.1 hypothetical protein [Xanthobacter aminoxidans]